MQTISPTFALRSPKVIHLLSGEHGEILGRLEVGWEKVVCWSTKAAISLKRVKTEEKLLWRAYRKSPTLFRFFGSPPYFYFRFRLYGHRDGRFCLIFARTAQQSVLVDGTNGLSSSELRAYCRIVQICQKCQGTSRRHLCDSTAFLFNDIQRCSLCCFALQSHIQNRWTVQHGKITYNFIRKHRQKYRIQEVMLLSSRFRQ